MKGKLNYLLLLVVSAVFMLVVLIAAISTRFLASTNSIFVTVALGLALNVVAHFVYQSAERKTSVKTEISPSLDAHVMKIRSLESQNSDLLSDDRKKHIVQKACESFPYLVAAKKEHLDRMQKAFSRSLSNSRYDVMSKPAWSSISYTNSDTGYRFVMGFKNSGCSYWRSDPFNVGCFSCGYCSGVVPDIHPTKEELEMQFEAALGNALEARVNFDVIEFLNDGSFFSDDEFPPDFRHYLFRKIAALPYIKRVLVETRPEYVNDARISWLLEELGPSKSLEVAIGLESADDFIRSVCNRKGFNLRDFESAVSVLASYRNQVTTVVYSLVKPAFINEVEAIEDEINTASYLSSLSGKLGATIVLKMEPAVVAKGTLLDFLYFQGNNTIRESYFPFSYWSMIEIICRLQREQIALSVRIGAREDMDIIQKIPAVYDSNGMFNKWDFILYEAVQSYNVHRSVARLLAEIDGAFSDNSFEDWKRKNGFQKTAIEECRIQFSEEIKNVNSQKDEQTRNAFLMKTFAALDRLEYGEKSVRFARGLSRKINRSSMDDIRREMQIFVESEFREVMRDVWLRVKEIYFEQDKPGLARIYIQLRDLKDKDAFYNIWAGIPRCL